MSSAESNGTEHNVPLNRILLLDMKSYMHLLTHKIHTPTYYIHNSKISYFLLDVLENCIIVCTVCAHIVFINKKYCMQLIKLKF